MRTWMALAVAALPALAWAQSSAPDQASGKSDQASDRSEQAGQKADQAGQEMKDAGRSTGQAASDAATATKDKAQDAGDRAGTAARHGGAEAQLFSSQDHFDLKGKVSKVGKSDLTLERKGLPPATLSVVNGTKIQRDGSSAHLSQLKAGDDVRASFNLDRARPIATEITADSGQGAGR